MCINNIGVYTILRKLYFFKEMKSQLCVFSKTLFSQFQRVMVSGGKMQSDFDDSVRANKALKCCS